MLLQGDVRPVRIEGNISPGAETKAFVRVCEHFLFIMFMEIEITKSKVGLNTPQVYQWCI